MDSFQQQIHLCEIYQNGFLKLFLYKFAYYTKKCLMITSITYKDLCDNYGI